MLLIIEFIIERLHQVSRFFSYLDNLSRYDDCVWFILLFLLIDDISTLRSWLLLGRPLRCHIFAIFVSLFSLRLSVWIRFLNWCSLLLLSSLFALLGLFVLLQDLLVDQCSVLELCLSKACTELDRQVAWASSCPFKLVCPLVGFDAVLNLVEVLVLAAKVIVGDSQKGNLFFELLMVLLLLSRLSFFLYLVWVFVHIIIRQLLPLSGKLFEPLSFNLFLQAGDYDL